METGIFILGCLACLMLGAAIGLSVNRAEVVTLTDVLKAPKEKRSEKQTANDAIRQLSNEIAGSGAVKQKTLPNGDVNVSITVLL